MLVIEHYLQNSKALMTLESNFYYALKLQAFVPRKEITMLPCMENDILCTYTSGWEWGTEPFHLW